MTGLFFLRPSAAAAPGREKSTLVSEKILEIF